MNYQKIILVGNAAMHAERRKAKKGALAYTSFSVAVADRDDKPTFFRVVVFGKQAEPVAKYVTKGRQVVVEGRIQESQTGRYGVVADRVQFGAKPQEKPLKKK